MPDGKINKSNNLPSSKRVPPPPNERQQDCQTACCACRQKSCAKKAGPRQLLALATAVAEEIGVCGGECRAMKAVSCRQSVLHNSSSTAVIAAHIPHTAYTRIRKHLKCNESYTSLGQVCVSEGGCALSSDSTLCTTATPGSTTIKAVHSFIKKGSFSVTIIPSVICILL